VREQQKIPRFARSLQRDTPAQREAAA
jgi:hypothetical protein